MNPAISKYMRELQSRSAASRWGGLSPAQRSAKMKALRAKAKRKPKRATRLPNKKVSDDR
jgi:predicted Fe-S protein YdhL (DUF1289 family)